MANSELDGVLARRAAPRLACWPAPLRLAVYSRVVALPVSPIGLYGGSGEVVMGNARKCTGMECRERAMGEYRRRRERGMGREEARMKAQSSDNRQMEREYDERERLTRENVAKGERWTCGCGMIVIDSFACLTCGQTQIGADMKRVQEKGKGLGHGAGDQYAGGREDEGGEGVSRARKEVSGYTHGGPSAPSDDELRAFAEGYRDEDSGGTYMLGIVIVAVITAVVFFCLGLGLGRVVYGI